MDTVLGMSMTSSGIAWVLQQGCGADAVTVDHDHFTLHGDVPTDGDISKHEAAARGARAIAEASGHQVRVIGLTFSNDVEAKARPLLKSLSNMGFDAVSAVPLADAAQQWARGFGRHLGFERCALCVVEPSAVTVVSVLYNFVRTATTQMRESADGIARWLTGVFEVNRSQPERLFLLGARGDLELVAATLDEALPMPVVASDEAQLVLARGAALAAVAEPEPAPAPGSTPKHVRPAAFEARPWARFSTPARAAAVLVAGVSALFAIGAGLAADDAPPVPTETAAETSTVAVHSATPSISVHTVPSVRAVPSTPAVVQQFAAAPAPTEAPPAVMVEAAPEAIPVVVEAAPAVAEPVTAAPVFVSEPAPEVAPVPAVLPAPPAPEALPAGPPPAAAPAPEVAPAPLPPPDPIQVVLSPLFGGLP